MKAGRVSNLFGIAVVVLYLVMFCSLIGCGGGSDTDEAECTGIHGQKRPPEACMPPCEESGACK